ncbi:uncharacterized protein LOC105217496 isoform X2 [Zeugodacus cucurbitae]|uniref:uncharacterized protein LOC105217496 isoform X2 n=1 Tax=Zeugodacus cucurbitae TaxID=28588 RepID=UPI0023D8EB94|nr:uncharacterized protein LOC105217496 isoform X2 [Zeugodacus cucurbitae]
MSTRFTTSLSTHKFNDYKLYAINFQTNSLNSICEEFKKRVRTGLRRRVFIIDLEEEAKQLALKVRNTKRFDNYTVAMEMIEDYLAEYRHTSNIIAEEKKFSLIDYWMDNLNVPTGATLSKDGKLSKKAAKKSPPKTPPKTTKATKMEKNKSMLKFPTCPHLAPKQHNTVGRPEPLSKRKYIQDEPEYSKIFIILIGDMDNDFYVKLLSAHQPLQAIIHFLPEECGYDVLLPHPQAKEQLANIIEQIQVDIFEMRTLALTKPVGYMQHYLPVISRCLAEKYSDQIYEQLCHYLYDIEVLVEQYERYYRKPFRTIDVQMPLNVKVEGLREIAESLDLQGTYLTAPLPAMASDVATIAIYFDGLLNQIAERVRKLTPQQVQISTLSYKQASAMHLNQELRDVYATAFDSILKVRHFERLCIAANNLLLHELLLYTNVDSFETIHYTSLEYNAMRSYIDKSCLKNAFQVQEYNELSDRDFYQLPYYAKLYFGENVVKQHLEKWLNEYTTWEVDEIMPGYKLYHFKRAYNEVNEEQQVVVLPSPLCFRDFTLFQMEEFIDALVTPEMIQTQYEQSYTSMHSFLKKSKKEKDNFGIDMSIFIRPTSLKWKKLKAYMDTHMSQAVGNQVPLLLPQLRPTNLSVRTKTSNMMEGVPGLPYNHHLLQGYNLEDVRQEIQIKSSKYYFEEGGVELYEERWCFTDMNKNLLLNANNILLNIFRPRFWNTAVSPCLRFTNKNNVSLRLLNTVDECAKIVINYPNGLSIYHNEHQVEQVWNIQDSVNREKNRFYVAEGAVIVHYQSADLIMVMRYNGEVYRLYQYEFPEGEEEAMQEMTDELDSSLKIEQIDSTINKDTARRSKRDTKKGKESDDEKEKDLDKEKRKVSVKGKEKDKDKEKEKEKGETAKAKASIKASARSKASSHKAVAFGDHIKHKTPKELLIESIDNELRFLNELTHKYSLTYLHLIVTTSSGHIVNLTHRGKVYKGRSKATIEWHDYFANESYAQRGDGVRMIWTADSLKCYHIDGTVIITKVEEKIEAFGFDADTAVTLSSSHIDEDYGDFSDSLSTGGNVKDGHRSKSTSPARKQSQKSATAKTSPSNKTGKKSGKSHSPHTRSNFHSTISHFFMSGEGEEGRKYDDASYVTSRHSSFHMLHKKYAEVLIELYEVPVNDIVITIVAIDGISAFIYKVLPTFENLNLDPYMDVPRYRSTMGDSATDTTTRKNTTATTKSSSIYTAGSDVHTSDSGKYTIEEEILVQTVVKVSFGNDLNICTTEEACDLALELEHYDEENNKVRMYVKIPKALCNTAEIHKFVEPIEDFTFKKTQHHLRDAIEYYLRPRIRIALAQLWSENNWKIKLEEHKSRMFREQQRTVLYQAMLRHQVYPKYWQFQHEFYSHVKDIDFFKFITLRCYKPIDEAVQATENAAKLRFEKDPRASEDRPPSIVEFPEKQPRYTEGGLQMRRSIAKYRSRTPPKCITTLTHITDQLDV